MEEKAIASVTPYFCHNIIHNAVGVHDKSAQKKVKRAGGNESDALRRKLSKS